MIVTIKRYIYRNKIWNYYEPRYILQKERTKELVLKEVINTHSLKNFVYAK